MLARAVPRVFLLVFVCLFELQGQRYENLVPLLLGYGTRGPAKVQTTMAEVKGSRLGLSDRLI